MPRVAISYTVICWLLLQIADVIFPAFGIPDKLMMILIIILIALFPVAMLTAWFFEIGPNGFNIAHRVEEGHKTPKQWKKRKPIVTNLFIIILLSLVVIQYIYFSYFRTESKIVEKIMKERTAIIPFENLSGNANLDNMGKVAANMINLGLAELETAEIVSPYTVTINLPSLGILPDDPNGRPSFAKLTGAENILTGSFNEENNQVIFNLSIQDAVTGKIAFVIPAISGSINDKEEVLRRVRERVLGYWATRNIIDTKLSRVPNYSAYEIYIYTINNSSLDLMTQLEKINELDSLFFLARIQLLNLSRWFDHESKPANFEFLDRHRNSMTSYEELWYDYVLNLYQGEPMKAFNTINQLRRRFPKDFWLNHDAAGVAYDDLGNFHLSQSVYDELPLENIDTIAQNATIYSNRVRNETVNLKVIQENERFENIAKVVNWKRFRSRGGFNQTLYAIIGQNEQKYEEYFNDFLTENIDLESQLAHMSNRFDWDYRSSFSTETMNNIYIEKANYLIKKANEKNISAKNLQYIIDIISGNEISPAEALDNYWKGLGLIKMNKFEEAKKIIQKLEEEIPRSMTIAEAYRMENNYKIGCLYAQMEDWENALKYLTIARQGGYFIGHMHFQYDKHLSGLWEDPNFQALCMPVEINQL